MAAVGSSVRGLGRRRRLTLRYSVSSSPIHSRSSRIPHSCDPPFGGWRERRDARTFRLKRVLTQGVKQMLRRSFPLLKRPDVEFTLECASFILFCAAFLHWVAQI